MSIVQESVSMLQQQKLTTQYLCFIGNMSVYEMKVLIASLKIKEDSISIFLTRKKRNEKTLQALKSNLAGNVDFISDFTEAEVLPILKGATMGTKLVLIGEWKLVRGLKQLATFVGFTDEEIIIKGLGDKEEQVFCLKCYQLNPKTDTAVISCSHCGQGLEVSSHYSKRHDAYLGFISLQAPE